MPLQIIILIPAHSTEAKFTYDLAQLCIYTAMSLPPDEGNSLGLFMVPGTYVHSARQELAELALAREGVTHVLWLDADMRFPADTIIRLLEHNKNVVGVNYSKRTIPPDYVAIKHLPENNGGVGVKCVTTADSTGLEEVDAIGMGIVLMTASAFNGLPDPKEKGNRWFWFEQLDEGKQIGEDVYFCQMLKKHGQKIYVDHDLSKVCSHIGGFEYRCAHAEAEYRSEGLL